MQNKVIALLCVASLLNVGVIAEVKNDCKQTVSGDNSNAVCAEQVTINNNGLTEEQFEKILKKREDSLLQRLKSANIAPKNKKQQQLLEIELKATQEKLADIEASYKEEKKIRQASDKALQQFKDQLPKAQIEKARHSLQQGDTQEAEQAFDDIVKKGSGAIALAAFQSGQLAENRVDYAKAMKQYKKAVVLEENNPKYLFEAGQVATIVADYSQAQEWLEQLLKIRITENKKGINLAEAQHELAGLYEFQGKYDEAEPLYKRSLSIFEKALGKDHSLVATTLNNLAGLYESQGKYDEAEPLFKRSLEIREKALGKDHPSVATTLNNLATLYYHQKKYKEAVPLFEQSLAILKAKFPNGHPNIDIMQGNFEDLKSKMK